MFHSIDFTQFCPLDNFVSMLLGMVMAFLSLFLILLILLQRGRGGGLAGALGGAGGQSAFGSKAGDTFTVLTVSLAGVWILVCAFAMWQLGPHLTQTASLETDISAGPGDDDAEDVSSGLVIPTTNDQAADAEDATLVPADAEAQAPTEAEAPADMEAAVTPSENAATPEAASSTNEAASPTDEAESPEIEPTASEATPADSEPNKETPAE